MPLKKEIEYQIDKNGCHVVIGGSRSSGYPSVSICGKQMRMHRYFATLKYGEIKNGLQVRHTCDNKECINPDHLILGTLQDNARDAKERHLIKRGEEHGMSRIRESDVLDIRKMINAGKKQKEIANIYGLDQSTISNINTRKHWGWLQ